MNQAWVVRGLPLIFLLVLTACGGWDGWLCSQAAGGSLAPTCSPPQPEPTVSPVGSWQGTLTTTTGGSGTQPFTAEISETDAEGADYAGVFTVGDTSYQITGRFNGSYDEGEYFVFSAPPPELQATLSPGTPYGFNWAGLMTETVYEGSWSIFDYDPDAPDQGSAPSSEGTFRLERTR